MKKYFLLILSGLLAFSGAMAQSFTLSQKKFTLEGTVTDKGDAFAIISNNSANESDSMFSWSIIDLNYPTDKWLVQFCDPITCIVDLGVGKGGDFVLNKGKTAPLKFTFDYNGNYGSGNVKVVVRGKAMSGTVDTISASATTWHTGISKTTRTKEISFYPNPVRDQLNFTYPAKQPIRVDIFNVLGVKVKSFTHEGATTAVAMSELKNGVYFLRFSDGSSVYSKQFTKAE